MPESLSSQETGRYRRYLHKSCTPGVFEASHTVRRAWQGCEDLEEVLSERLQQLPAPLESAPSAGSQQEPPVVIPDDLPAERERVRPQPALTHDLIAQVFMHIQPVEQPLFSFSVHLQPHDMSMHRYETLACCGMGLCQSPAPVHIIGVHANELPTCVPMSAKCVAAQSQQMLSLCTSSLSCSPSSRA